MATLYATSLLALPDAPRIPRAGAWALAGAAILALLQLLPLPWLYPHTTGLRAIHGTGPWGPGTGALHLTLSALTQLSACALAALLALRLRHAGLTTTFALRSVVLVLAAEAAFAFVRLFAGWERPPFYEGQVSDPRSAAGTLVNRNHFAGLMAMGLAIAAALAAARFTWPPRRSGSDGPAPFARRLESGLGWGLAAALFAAAVVASKSRGGALAALAGLALLPAFYRGRASVAGGAAVVAAAAAAVLAADPAGLLARFGDLDPFELSADSRATIWSETARAALRQPLLGFGLGTHPLAFHPFQPPTLAGQINHAHSEPVNLLFEVGFLGLAAALAAGALALRAAWRGLRALHGPDRLPAAGAAAALATLALHATVDFAPRLVPIGLLGGALLGLLGALSRTAEPRPAAAWASTGAAALLAAALCLVPARGSIALSPYDHELAWERGDFPTAGRLFPAFADLQREIGLRAWRAGREDVAAECFHRLFAQRPEAAAGVLEAVWDPARPLADVERLLPPSPRAWASYAAFLARQGQWEPSMQAFERGCPASPGSAPAHDLYAAALAEVGQWGLEARVRERRLTVRSDPWAYGAAAQAWLRLGAWELAEERAATAARIDPASAAWPGLVGEARAAKGERTGALEAFTAAVGRQPAELSWRLRRGQVALEEKAWALAAADFDAVRRSRPRDRAATLGLAKAWLGEERRDAARMLLDEWLSRTPDDEEAKALRRRAAQ